MSDFKSRAKRFFALHLQRVWCQIMGKGCPEFIQKGLDEIFFTEEEAQRICDIIMVDPLNNMLVFLEDGVGQDMSMPIAFDDNWKLVEYV